MVIPIKFCDDLAMSNRDTSNPFEDEGRRLALVRRVLGLSQVELSERLNLRNSRWSNWEVGANQIPPSVVTQLKRLLPGLDQDWIYEGDRSGLSHQLAATFDKVASEPEDTGTKKKRGRPSRH